MNLQVQVALSRSSFNLDVQVELTSALNVIAGDSGAGKTTLLDIVAGVASPDSGRVLFNGQTLLDVKGAIDVPVEHRRFGYVFQDDLLFPHLNVRHNLEYGQRSSHRKEHRIDASDVVGALGLQALLQRRPASLSGGERRRVAIGRALLASPRLLLLDEPFTGLNPELKTSLADTLLTLNRDFHLPMVIVTHDRVDALEQAATLLTMRGGRLALQG